MKIEHIAIWVDDIEPLQVNHVLRAMVIMKVPC